MKYIIHTNIHAGIHFSTDTICYMHAHTRIVLILQPMAQG